MKQFSFFLMFILLFSAGCASKSRVTDAAIEAKHAELTKQSASRTVEIISGPYLGAKRTALSVSDKVLVRHMSLNMAGTLAEVCTAVAPLTNLTWQMADGSPDVVRKVRFDGSIEGFCEYLSTQYSVEWHFDPDSRRIVFSQTGTRTFTLLAAPGRILYKNQITNQSKESNTGSGGGMMGQTVNSSDVSSQTAQSNTTDLGIDVWSEALNTIKGIISKNGSVAANPAAGTVTVTDTSPALRRVEQFVNDFNHKISRQVALDVRVWQLSINDESDIGLNLQALFEEGKVGLSTGMSMNWANSGGEINAKITGGKLKDSQATLKALSTFGRTSLITSGSGVTMNNQPFPVQNTTKDTYLAGMSLNTSDYGQTSQITPGEVTTGFAMTVIPHILERRTVILQYNASLTSLDAIREYSNSTIKVEMPKVSTRAFSQRTTMKMGQTLVLAGFEQESSSKDDTLGFLAAGRKGTYGRTLIIITISVESMQGYDEEEGKRG